MYSKTNAGLIAIIVSTVLFVGCRSVNPHRVRGDNNKRYWSIKSDRTRTNIWHDVVVETKRKSGSFPLIKKLNPVWWFGNEDDPQPPKNYLPGRKLRTLRWYFRNPMHNFGHYVIGIKDKDFVRSGRYPERISNPNGGWNYAVSKYKRLRLPFVSFKGKHVEWYFGWRNSGNFGIAVRKAKKDKEPSINRQKQGSSAH